MWAQLTAFFGKLFGGKGTIQVGKDQQAVNGSTTGANSPIITAAGNINYNPNPNPPAPTQAEREAELFAEIQALMPEILDSIRANLAEDPLLRTLVVFESSTIAYNCNTPHLLFANDTHPNATRKFDILESHGLVRMNRPGFYEISPRFVRILKTNPA